MKKIREIIGHQSGGGGIRLFNGEAPVWFKSDHRDEYTALHWERNRDTGKIEMLYIENIYDITEMYSCGERYKELKNLLNSVVSEYFEL